MTTEFARTPLIKDNITHYCPGCGHGVAHRLIAECIDELDMAGKTLGIAPVGCSVLAYNYIDVDMIEVAHGRAPAVATGMKRMKPNHLVFSYQGDGDLASIGAGEILHAAHRGENITVVFINNAVYGMTGGQMAPTTLTGQVTQTTPDGRDEIRDGYPMQISEILAVLPGTSYIERCALFDPTHIRKAKKAIKHAFELQMANSGGMQLVEILSQCPTYWRMSPTDAVKWVKDEMVKCFPLGKLKG